MSPHPPRILVIGYGNPLRGDDGAGWQAAERLDELLPPDQVCVYIRHQITPELAELASQVELLVLIDASCIDPPGHIAAKPVEPAKDTTLSLLHEVTAPQLLGLAGTLFGHAPETVLFSIGGEDFAMREGLTPAVQTAVDQVVPRVRQLVEERLAAAPCCPTSKEL